jgi:hypothetical protein
VEKENYFVENSLSEFAVENRPLFSTGVVGGQILAISGVFPFFHRFFAYDCFF